MIYPLCLTSLQINWIVANKTLNNIILIMTLCNVGCTGKLQVTPAIHFAHSGTNVTFNCCMEDISPTTLRFFNASSKDSYAVYNDKQVYPPFRSKFTFDNSLPPCLVWTIQDTNVNDAGTYMCTEQNEMGTRISSELSIFGTFNIVIKFTSYFNTLYI